VVAFKTATDEAWVASDEMVTVYVPEFLWFLI
jgi:hypothetical protein